jgi:hypothetical protein
LRHRAGSRPGGRPTFCCARKLDKEALSKLSARHRMLVEARALRLACPARTELAGSSSAHSTAVPPRSGLCRSDLSQARSQHAAIGAASSLLSGTTAEATAVVRGGFVRAGQASRSAWVTKGAPASTRSLASASWSNFLARQKVGRPPGRDPARCNAPAKPQQGAQTRPAAQRLLRARPGRYPSIPRAFTFLPFTLPSFSAFSALAAIVRSTAT